MRVAASPKPTIALVTPAVAATNNGNWHTAARWARLLAGHYRVQVLGQWPAETKEQAPRKGGPANEPQALIALHARRSAPSIQAWRERHPKAPLVVVLTGTDLYRDIQTDPSAQRSLQLADRLIALNELAHLRLPKALHAKLRVCLQSAPAVKPAARTSRYLRVVMAGHLRAEKAPETFMQAARLLKDRSDIRFDHIGGPMDPAYAEQARALERECPHYRWLGALPHAATRKRIAAAHVLVNASHMEGGAQVVIEAVQSQTPVVLSAIEGHLGLVGQHYAATFAPGNAKGLAALLSQARDEPAMLARWQHQCAARQALFEPAQEQASLLAVLGELL